MALSMAREAIRSWKRALLGKREGGERRALLRRMPRAGVCAEIGVWKGDFSELIRSETSPARLHLIDPWEFQPEFPERMYGGTVAKQQADMDRICEAVRGRFRSFPQIVLHRGKSEAVLAQFEAGYFDWVYVDGNHAYEFVLGDLRLCFAKVKRGGLIAGDDYNWSAKDGFPVRTAVRDFLKEKDLADRLEVLGSQFIIRL